MGLNRYLLENVFNILNVLLLYMGMVIIIYVIFKLNCYDLGMFICGYLIYDFSNIKLIFMI